MPTRWEKAKQDWPGFQRRDLLVGLPALREAERDVNGIIRGQAKQRREQADANLRRLFMRRSTCD